jgi:hypothetical protein
MTTKITDSEIDFRQLGVEFSQVYWGDDDAEIELSVSSYSEVEPLLKELQGEIEADTVSFRRKRGGRGNQCKKGVSCSSACINRAYACEANVPDSPDSVSRAAEAAILSGGVGVLPSGGGSTSSGGDKKSERQTLETAGSRARVAAFRKRAGAVKNSLKEELTENQLDDLAAFAAGSVSEVFAGGLAGPLGGSATKAAKKAAQDIQEKIKNGEIKNLGDLTRQIAKSASSGARPVAIKTLQKMVITQAFNAAGFNGEAVDAIAEITAEVSKAAAARNQGKLSDPTNKEVSKNSKRSGRLRSVRRMAQSAKDLVDDLGVGVVTNFRNPEVQKQLAGNFGQQVFQLGAGFGLSTVLGGGATIGLGALPLFGSIATIGLPAFGAAMASAAAGNLARKYAIDPAIENIDKRLKRRQERLKRKRKDNDLEDEAVFDPDAFYEIVEVTDDAEADFSFRQWDADDRDRLAEGDIKGAFADPDNQKYPIADREDVGNAWNLAGKSSDPDAIRRRIIEIAKQYGWEDGLPQTAIDWAQDREIVL